MRQERIAAIILSYKRPQNIPLVVAGLKKQSCIQDIVVIHNAPSNERVDGCINIVSDINLGCLIRHKIAEFLEYDYFIFHDDDLCLTEDISPILSREIEKHRTTVGNGEYAILGPYGRNLGYKMVAPPRPYSRGVEAKYDHSKDVTPVDIVKGRFHIMSKLAICLLSESAFNTPILLAEDDIRANVSMKFYGGAKSYLIPIRQYLRELPDNDSLFRRPTHFNDRDTAIMQARKIQQSLTQP